MISSAYTEWLWAKVTMVGITSLTIIIVTAIAIDAILKKGKRR